MPEPRVTLQFHPDWPHDGRTVIESMAEQGTYLSQFTTGISNGGLTAHPGGDRWRWESRLFEGRYDEAQPDARPVYGAWDRRCDPYGGAIRFGSAHLRLRPEATTRSTFCFPDSVFDPVDVGGPEQLERLCRMADEARLDDLDDYVEAHVHGSVRFDTDVEAIVLDPAHRGTRVEDAANRLGCTVEFHPGFRADPATFDPDYRGAHVVQLARSLTEDGPTPVLTPPEIGAARRIGEHDPQTVKQVWHCLARFGRST